MTIAEAREAWTFARARAEKLHRASQEAKAVERMAKIQEAWDAYMKLLKAAQTQEARAARIGWDHTEAERVVKRALATQ
jgi:hypothetical protein